MKKKLLLILIFALACAVFAFGCKKNGESSDSGDKEPESSLNIVDSALTLDCFETYTLSVESHGIGVIVWESSDPSIVSVNENGFITAGMKLGTATITAKSGEYSDKCDVTVLLKSGLPQMKAENKVIVSEGGYYNVQFGVYYNSIDVSEYQVFGCDEVNENGGTVATASVNGNVVTFSGIAEGETAFSVYTTVFGILYAEKVTVSVRNTDVVYIVDGIVDNRLQVRPGNAKFTSDVAVYDKNVRVPDGSLEWSISDETVVKIGENGELVPNMEGVAVLSTSYRGKVISVEVAVVKDREYIVVEQENPADFDLDIDISVDASAQKRTYTVNEAKNNSLSIGADADNGVVVRAMLGSDEMNVEGLTFADGVITIPTKFFGIDNYGEKTLTVEVEDKEVVRVYTFELLLITKIPHTLADFKSAITVQWRGDRILGYFALGDDLDFNQYTISTYATDWVWDNGFRGTLDGRGYALKNMKATTYGISAQMGEGAVLKNLKISDVKFDGVSDDGNYGATIFARGAVGVTFENIEINLTADSKCTFNNKSQKDNGLLVSHDMRRCIFKNITIRCAGKDIQRIFGGSGNEKGSSTYENVVIYAKSVAYYENDMVETPDGVTLISEE